MKKFLFSIFLLLFFVSFANAGTIDCYVGAKKISSVPAENIGGAVWVSLPGAAQALGFDVEKLGEEIILTNKSNKNFRIRVIENTTAAWVSNRLISLYEAPKIIDGSAWLGERSAGALFRGIFGNDQPVSFKNPLDVDAPRTAEQPKQTDKPTQKPVKDAETRWIELTDKIRESQSQKEAPAGVPIQVNQPKENNIVVIDAGHGGQDPGAVANGIREKDLNLAVALKLENVLKSKGVQVEMTRKTDVYLPLAARTEVANRLNAKIFISVHANALPKGKSATGFEIYLMALPTDRDALDLAKFENRELVDGKMNIEVSDKNTSLLVQTLSQEEKKKVALILGDMKQNDKITRSTRLTEQLYSAGNQSGIPMRRVAQAPFFVLRGTDNVISVLLETGFVTDAREAKLLAHPGYQQRIADAMAAGVVAYLKGGE